MTKEKIIRGEWILKKYIEWNMDGDDLTQWKDCKRAGCDYQWLNENNHSVKLIRLKNILLKCFNEAFTENRFISMIDWCKKEEHIPMDDFEDNIAYKRTLTRLYFYLEKEFNYWFPDSKNCYILQLAPQKKTYNNR